MNRNTLRRYICTELDEIISNENHFIWRIPRTRILAVRKFLYSGDVEKNKELHLRWTLSALRLLEPSELLDPQEKRFYEQEVMNINNTIHVINAHKHTKAQLKRSLKLVCPELQWQGDTSTLEYNGCSLFVDVSDGASRLMRFWRPIGLTYEGCLGLFGESYDNIGSIEMAEFSAMFENLVSREKQIISMMHV